MRVEGLWVPRLRMARLRQMGIRILVCLVVGFWIFDVFELSSYWVFCVFGFCGVVF